MFIDTRFVLTTSASGSGTTRVTHPGKFHGKGDLVRAEAIPSPGMVLAGRSGIDSSQNSTASITMNSNRAIRADFREFSPSWRTQNFPPGEIEAGMANSWIDADGDGFSNNKEFLFATDPDLDYQFQISEDLETWVSIPLEDLRITSIVDRGNNSESVTVSFDASAPIMNVGFIRVRARPRIAPLLPPLEKIPLAAVPRLSHGWMMARRVVKIPEEGFEGLIFDLDGTLIDSMPAHYEAMRRALEEEGGKGLFPKKRLAELGGKPAADIVTLLNKEHGLSMNAQKVCARQHEILESNLGNFDVIPEVADYASRYRGKVPMAVASAGTSAMVKASLKSVDMLSWFDAIVGSDEVKSGKPAPDVYLEAARRINVDPANCVVFEDSEAGIRAARSAGMTVIPVPPPL